MGGISDKAQKIRSTLQRDKLNDVPLSEKRRSWDEFARSVPVSENIVSEDVLVGGVPCMLQTTKDSAGSNDVIVYIHGGGLVEGSVNTSREWCSRLCAAARQPVLSIDYRLAPEYPYPAALSDVLSVCESLLDPSTSGTISSIGADSSGSILALSALVRRRELGATLPASCFLLSPSIDLSFSGASMKINKDVDLVVSEDVLMHYAQLYASGQDLASAQISPLFADLRGLPPILIQVDRSELLLDDAVRLQACLNRLGERNHLEIADGLWHAWPTWGDFPEACVATDQIVTHIKEACEHGSDRA